MTDGAIFVIRHRSLVIDLDMDFRQRLQKAAERGQRAHDARLREAAAKALSEEECRRLHSQYRLPLCEHIEQCLHELADSLPGFRVNTIVDEGGWGAEAVRDDLRLAAGRRGNLFSRLQIIVRPYNQYHVLDLVAKGTVRNRETFSRNHYQPLSDVELDRFNDLVEVWVLDYAEMYAAAG
jgi:hypothetical protein